MRNHLSWLKKHYLIVALHQGWDHSQQNQVVKSTGTSEKKKKPNKLRDHKCPINIGSAMEIGVTAAAGTYLYSIYTFLFEDHTSYLFLSL